MRFRVVLPVFCAANINLPSFLNQTCLVMLVYRSQPHAEQWKSAISYTNFDKLLIGLCGGSKITFAWWWTTAADAYFVSGAMEQVKRKCGYLDIVCNNAGITSVDADVERSTQAIHLNMVTRWCSYKPFWVVPAWCWCAMYMRVWVYSLINMNNLKTNYKSYIIHIKVHENGEKKLKVYHKQIQNQSLQNSPVEIQLCRRKNHLTPPIDFMKPL